MFGDFFQGLSALLMLTSAYAIMTLGSSEEGGS